MPSCPDCHTEYATTALSCPACQRLVHGERLRTVAADAAARVAAGDRDGAIDAWHEALSLLPPASRQATQVREEIAALVRAGEMPAAPPPAKAGSKSGRVAGIGMFGLLLWKFKSFLLLALTKGKALLLGLTKLQTLGTMLLSMGVYWTTWGWKFAVGFVLSIYVHEMGHVMALRRLGIPASAPMFIPGVGAFVRLKQSPANVRDDAEVGLAGPLWGAGTALACAAVHLMTGSPFWGAMARVGAWINLFNLLPIWQLDGGRGFRALNRSQRGWAAGAIGLAWLYSSDGILLLLLLGALYRVFFGEQAPEPHRRTLVVYVGLIAVLSWLCAIEVAG